MPSRHRFHPFRRLVIVAAIGATVPAGPAVAAPCWQPPVTAPVTDPFREPACRWCPGNRGVEYGTPPGTPVRAVATGRVTFAGAVAGTSYVVVEHADGRRVTYGNLRPTRWRSGEVVVRGALVGTTAGRLHFGLRDAGRYVDPARYLGRLTFRPRLVPSDGSPGAPAGPPQRRCGT